ARKTGSGCEIFSIVGPRYAPLDIDVILRRDFRRTATPARRHRHRMPVPPPPPLNASPPIISVLPSQSISVRRSPYPPIRITSPPRTLPLGPRSCRPRPGSPTTNHPLPSPPPPVPRPPYLPAVSTGRRSGLASSPSTFFGAASVADTGGCWHSSSPIH